MAEDKEKRRWEPPDEEEKEELLGFIKHVAGRLRPDLSPPPVYEELDVGRNDPCPCGSGKKFKRCHGKGRADVY